VPSLELACPFCQSRHVEALGAEGASGELVRLRCGSCRQSWSENLSARTRDRLRALGITRQPRPLVLNVDDHAASLYARDRLLRHHGFDVANASTGHSALTLAEQLRPALILLDVHLPDIAGPDVCARLKARTSTAAIPIVLISASGAAEGDDVARAGAARFVAEPVEGDALASTLRDVIGAAS
jgi:CheY-like chemotaxis protein